MSNQFTTTDDYRAAKAYASENPLVTAHQLREMFSDLTSEQSRQVAYKARKAASLRPLPRNLVLPPQQRNNLDRLNPDQRAIAEDAARRRIAALEYAREHLDEYPTHIARKFRTPTQPITEFMLHERAKIESQRLAANPKLPTRRLYAITTDGEQIDPRRVRDVSKIERFVEVMV
jgi:hypothetical protein